MLAEGKVVQEFPCLCCLYVYYIRVLFFILFTDLNWTLLQSWSECLLNKQKKPPKPSKQTRANLLGSFEYCNGNWISVTGWLVTVETVMGVFVARVLAMTSSWIEQGSSNLWSAPFSCAAGLWSHTALQHTQFLSIACVKLCAKHLWTIS